MTEDEPVLVGLIGPVPIFREADDAWEEPGAIFKRFARTLPVETWYPLYPKRVVDVACRGAWTRDYRSQRRWFKTRYYYAGRRVPWLAWAMFS